MHFRKRHPSPSLLTSCPSLTPAPPPQVCVLEAYMDLYLMTAQPLYLAGVLGAWAMLRDPTQGWLFPGGSFGRPAVTHARGKAHGPRCPPIRTLPCALCCPLQRSMRTTSTRPAPSRSSSPGRGASTRVRRARCAHRPSGYVRGGGKGARAAWGCVRGCGGRGRLSPRASLQARFCSRHVHHPSSARLCRPQPAPAPPVADERVLYGRDRALAHQCRHGRPDARRRAVLRAPPRRQGRTHRKRGGVSLDGDV